MGDSSGRIAESVKSADRMSVQYKMSDGNRPMQTKSSGINRDHGRRWNKEKRCLLSVSVNIVKI